jgi:hypothetical protein
MTCSHGHPGYCHDDATPEERESFAFLHSHAFAWASPDERAEEYATHYAQTFYRADHQPAHSDEFMRWSQA